MAAALVGGAVLSSFFNVFFERLVPEDVRRLFQGDKLIEKLLKTLNIKLLSATALLNDAEEKQLGDTNVRNWLDQLKEVVYKADSVTDKINTEAQRLEMNKDESTTTRKRSRSNVIINSFKLSVVKSEIEEILDTLEDLLKQSDHLGLKKVDQKFTTLHTPHAPLLDDLQVHGRVDDKKAILKLLLCDGDATSPNISVVPIVGMGGIGKTTLAQSVYYDDNVEKHFALKVWVTISDDFDVLRITKLILEAIPKAMSGTVELHRIQKDLKDALAGKKFLFVFDDVWNEKYELWHLLQSSFQSGAKGSKVIVTTRNEDIALKMKTRNVQIYELKTMSDDGCWQLFEEHAFDNVDRNEKVLLGQLQEIGRKIVKKCKGVPLAVKSMAGLLRSMRTCEDWRHVLQSDVWKRQDCRDIGIVPALWLSYRFLPPYLKPCFSYLSIFPKDYEFRDVDREKLIFIWMAEGLLQSQEGRRIEDVGEDYLNALISRSFFQRNTRNHSFSMHDHIHDLAVYVSGQSFLSYDSCKKDLHKLSSKTHHLSYEDFLNTKEIDFTKVKNLRSLIRLPLRFMPSYLETDVQEVVLRNGRLRVLSIVGEHIDSNFNLKHLRYLDASNSEVKKLPASICELYNLETLLLSRCRMLTKLPDSIGNLKYLRYLDVSHTEVKELPDSVCLLFNLETLLLKSCKQLTLLPTKICELINLRQLNITSSSLKEMPPRIFNMKNLQKLSDFILCENDGYRIKELGKLDNLHGHLRISRLEHVREVNDVLEVNLKNKEYLTELTLEWRGKTNDSIRDREVLSALQPHPNLKSLQIVGYEGTKLPEWVVDPLYSNLEVVSLQGQNCCLSLLSFQHLSSLKKLHIMGTIDVPNEFCNNSSHNSFLVLEEIRLTWITALDWSSINTNYQNGDIFPCLKRFTLLFCDGHVALPMGNFPYLEEIMIKYCDELVTVFPSTTDIDVAYPSLRRLEIQNCFDLVTVFPSSSTDIDVAYPSLRDLRISNCSRLESFSEMGLLPVSLETLSIEPCSTVIENRMQWKTFTKLTVLRLANYGGVVDSFPEEGLLPPNLTHLTIKNFDKLTALNANGFHHLTSLQELVLSTLGKLECLPIGLPQTLTTLWIAKCPLLIPRCNRETGEDWPNIQHIPNIYINHQIISGE